VTSQLGTGKSLTLFYSVYAPFLPPLCLPSPALKQVAQFLQKTVCRNPKRSSTACKICKENSVKQRKKIPKEMLCCADTYSVPRCTENPIYLFPEMKLRGLVLNSYSQVSLSDLCIPRIDLPIWLLQNRQTETGNI